MRSHVYSTYPVGKISMKFKANRFFIFKLRNSFANYFSNCYEIITADLLVPALYPHTGVDVSDNLFSDAVWDVFSVLKYRWRWEREIIPLYLEDFEVGGLGVSTANPKLPSLWYSGSDSSDNVVSGRSNCKVWWEGLRLDQSVSP